MFSIFKKREKPWYEKGGHPKPRKHPIAMKLFEPPPGHVGPYEPTPREVNVRLAEMLNGKDAPADDGKDSAD